MRVDSHDIIALCAHPSPALTMSTGDTSDHVSITYPASMLALQELVMARNNNKTSITDMELRFDKAAADRGQLEAEVADLRQELADLRKENNRIAEENKNSKIAVSDLQAELKGAKHRSVCCHHSRCRCHHSRIK